MCAKTGSSGIPYCPRCGGQEIWRNGETSAGKQQWRCRSCSRVFVLEPYMKKDIRIIADRMIGEGIPVPKIAFVLDGFVSRRWLYVRKGVLHG